MLMRWRRCDFCKDVVDTSVEFCKCKCEDTLKPMLKVSETLVLGIDISGGKDISRVQVTRVIGNTCKVVNTFYGEKADEIYDSLIKQPTAYNSDNQVT